MNQLVSDKGYESNVITKEISLIKVLTIILVISCLILSTVLVVTKSMAKTPNNNDNTDLPILLNKDNTIAYENKIEQIQNEVQNQEENKINNIININEEVKLPVIEEPVVHTASDGKKYTVIAKLSIPSLNINMDVLSDTSNALLKISLNKYWGAEPNEVGNMCIVGHNYENGTHFSNLSNINIGDIIKITDNYGRTLTYTVYDTFVVDPYDTSCTSQLTNGNIETTLITCYNNGKERFVVKARV